MAQFDVYRLPDGRHLVDLQTDLVTVEASRITAPMVRPTSPLALTRLTPPVRLNDQDWVVIVPQLAAIPARNLRQRVGSLSDHADEIFRAIDILTHGF
ncbi:CcdB family protein [Paracoccus luteus]|uniref:CcdB family protein n=1 Tax=Paracoccus luteus TaxID=2508543 RepID=UPI00106F8599|nr:CcdB family protein [Paracoccus luteus]